MSFTNFTAGHSHSFGGEYLELVPFERICHTDKFDEPHFPGEMKTTVSLKKVSCGTEVNIVQAGVPDNIPPQACDSGGKNRLPFLRNLLKPKSRDNRVVVPNPSFQRTAQSFALGSLRASRPGCR